MQQLILSGNFIKSFLKLEPVETKKMILLFLSKLAQGWRPRRGNAAATCESSAKFLKQFKVGNNYVICTVDIAKESFYTQTLKVWDVLPPQEIPKLTKRLDNIFRTYTEDYICRCSIKCFEGYVNTRTFFAFSMCYEVKYDFTPKYVDLLSNIFVLDICASEVKYDFIVVV